MYTPQQRDHLRLKLLEYAANDGRITGTAITGSAAAGREDQWSDIDLAFGIGDVGELPSVISDWTGHMYDRHHALHHVDVVFGAWTYRVFLLPSTLQVDVAFAPATEFRALSPTFRLILGEAQESRYVLPPRPTDIIGLGWLYALHARTCIAREKFWQAEYMISGVRDNALALACLRYGLPVVHGSGIDILPRKVAAQFEESLVRQIEAKELSRAYRVVIGGLLSEIRIADSDLAGRLDAVLMSLIETSR
jgi:predicted nucleotidyltransferase